MNEIQATPPSDVKTLNLSDLNAKELVVLRLMVLYPSWQDITKKMKISRARYFVYQKKLRPYLDQLNRSITEETFTSLAVTAQRAVRTFYELLEKGDPSFQKDVASEVLDRFGLIKKQESVAPTPPPSVAVTNILASKWDQYEKK